LALSPHRAAPCSKNNEFFSGAGIITVIPEPTTAIMLTCGGLRMLLALQRRRRIA